MVSWIRCGTSLYRFLIFAVFFTLKAPIFSSFYDIHVEEWLKVFPREQLFIFRHEDYINDIKGTLVKVFKFLDIGE